MNEAQPKESTSPPFAILLATFLLGSGLTILVLKAIGDGNSEWLGFAGNALGAAIAIVGAIGAVEWQEKRRIRGIEQRLAGEIDRSIRMLAGINPLLPTQDWDQVNAACRVSKRALARTVHLADSNLGVSGAIDNAVPFLNNIPIDLLDVIVTAAKVDSREAAAIVSTILESMETARKEL